WIQFHSLVERFQSLGIFGHLAVLHPELRIYVRAGVQHGRLAQLLDRFFGLSGAIISQSPVEQKIVARWIYLRRFVKFLHCLAATSGLKIRRSKLKAGAQLIGRLGNAVAPQIDRASPKLIALVRQRAFEDQYRAERCDERIAADLPALKKTGADQQQPNK